jgi:hypothetical protein
MLGTVSRKIINNAGTVKCAAPFALFYWNRSECSPSISLKLPKDSMIHLEAFSGTGPMFFWLHSFQKNFHPFLSLPLTVFFLSPHITQFVSQLASFQCCPCFRSCPIHNWKKDGIWPMPHLVAWKVLYATTSVMFISSHNHDTGQLYLY